MTSARKVKTGKALSLHQQAIESVLATNPAIQRNGFWIAMRDLWERVHHEWDDEDELQQRTFIPDAFLILEADERIILFEIEDSHPLSHHKRALIGRFWFSWDCVGIEGWDVDVIVVNRFGMATHTLRGVDLYLENIAQSVMDDEPSRVAEAPSR